MSTGCDCEKAGYCVRHARTKTEHLFRLCKTDQRYFDRWENPRTAEPPSKEQSEREAARLAFLRELWLELHGYNPERWDSQEAENWFARWLKRVPSFGCKCKQHFQQLIEKYPPDFSSHEAFHRWTIDRHNDVNKTLGKPLMPLEEALAMYGSVTSEAANPLACTVCKKPSTRICGYTLSLGMCGCPLCDDCAHSHSL